VGHRPHAGVTQVIPTYDAFPLNLLVAFSARIANIMKSSPGAHNVPYGIALHGGSDSAHCEILEWMLTCSRAGSILQFRTIYMSEDALVTYCQVFEEAKYLQIPPLVGSLVTRIERILAGQVHDSCIAKIYETYPTGHMWRDKVAQSIANAWSAQPSRLRHEKKYVRLGREIEDFGKDVDELMYAIEQKKSGKNKQSTETRTP